MELPQLSLKWRCSFQWALFTDFTELTTFIPPLHLDQLHLLAVTCFQEHCFKTILTAVRLLICLPRTIKVEVYDWDRDGRWAQLLKRGIINMQLHSVQYSTRAKTHRASYKTSSSGLTRESNFLSRSNYIMSQTPALLFVPRVLFIYLFVILTGISPTLFFLPATTSLGILRPATES